MFNNVFGDLLVQNGVKSDLFWATVTSVNPLQIRVDNDTQSLPAVTNSITADLVVGGRCLCKMVGGCVLILGAAKTNTEIIADNTIYINGVAYQYNGTSLLNSHTLTLHNPTSLYVCWDVAVVSIPVPPAGYTYEFSPAEYTSGLPLLVSRFNSSTRVRYFNTDSTPIKSVHWRLTKL